MYIYIYISIIYIYIYTYVYIYMYLYIHVYMHIAYSSCTWGLQHVKSPLADHLQFPGIMATPSLHGLWLSSGSWTTPLRSAEKGWNSPLLRGLSNILFVCLECRLQVVVGDGCSLQLGVVWMGQFSGIISDRLFRSISMDVRWTIPTILWPTILQAIN